MATPTYNVDYEDERFAQVEADKEAALNDVSDTYNNMINQTDQYYQAQIDASKQWAEQQKQIQQDNTDFAIEKIEQQKQQTEQDYTKEQKGAYADFQKQTNQYGVNAENMAASGLNNTGYSESSQVSMYNQYQNRVATAREVFNRAVLNYDNSIKEAQLANNSALAEIAYQALQVQLQLSLEGFQYKNSLLETQLQMEQQTEDRYYSRWQDVLNQVNQENQFAESIRQYEQNYKFQQEQFAEQIRQYNQSYEQQIKEFDESIRQFNEEIARLKKKDAEEYALQIQQLELQKQKAKEEQEQWKKEYQLKKKQIEQEQENWEKEYALAKESSSGGSGGSGGGSRSYTYDNSSSKTADQYGNSATTQNKSDYYFSNGYQPRYINNTKVEKSGLKVYNVFAEGTSEKTATSFGKQNIWKANGKYYVWDGGSKQYVDVTNKVKDSQARGVNFKWGM